MLSKRRALSAVANLVVIIGIAFYLWSAAGPIARERSPRDRTSPIELAREEWERLTDAGSRLGHGAGPASLIEFLDYECSYCAEVNRVIEDYTRDHPDFAIVIRHYPLSTQTAAEGAARAAVCAEAQGYFGRMHARLFESEDWQTTRNWGQLAKDAGIPDLEEFGQCLLSSEARARIIADRAMGILFGVRATPTFISSKWVHAGSLDRATLTDLASGALAR